MFRRFMIVCWALFSVSVILGLAGGAMTMRYQTNIDATQVRLDQLGKWTPEEALADMLAEDSDENPYIGQIQRSQDRSLLELEIANLSSKQGPWLTIALIGIFVGCILLLWNIFCHTVRWIWMGRRTT